MFKSFFPNPKWFFSSFVLWFLINLALWYSGGNSWGTFIGFPTNYATDELPISVSRFWSAQFIWFYLWFFISTAIFAAFSPVCDTFNVLSIETPFRYNITDYYITFLNIRLKWPYHSHKS